MGADQSNPEIDGEQYAQGASDLQTQTAVHDRPAQCGDAKRYVGSPDSSSPLQVWRDDAVTRIEPQVVLMMVMLEIWDNIKNPFYVSAQRWTHLTLSDKQVPSNQLSIATDTLCQKRKPWPQEA